MKLRCFFCRVEKFEVEEGLKGIGFWLKVQGGGERLAVVGKEIYAGGYYRYEAQEPFQTDLPPPGGVLKNQDQIRAWLNQLADLYSSAHTDAEPSDFYHFPQPPPPDGAAAAAPSVSGAGPMLPGPGELAVGWPAAAAAADNSPAGGQAAGSQAGPGQAGAAVISPARSPAAAAPGLPVGTSLAAVAAAVIPYR